jgi:hypothetical protein
MILDKRKYIDLYQSVFDYYKLNEKNTINIDIIRDNDNYTLVCDYFEPNEIHPFENVLNTDRIHISQDVMRDISISDLLDDGNGNDEPQSIKDSKHIKYLRFERNFKKFLINRDEKMLEYVENGTPVYIGWGFKEPGVINRVLKGEKCVMVYSHNSKEVTKKRISEIYLREKKEKVPVEELEPELVSMSTKELLSLKNRLYIPSDDYYSYTRYYDIEDVKKVLAHREHIERKS